MNFRETGRRKGEETYTFGRQEEGKERRCALSGDRKKERRGDVNFRETGRRKGEET